MFTLVLRYLPREALLQLRLTSPDVCSRVSMLLSDERVGLRHFERRLRVPDALDGVPDVMAILRRLCSRFGIKPNSWSLKLDVRVQADAEGYAISCSGMSAREVLAAVAATPLDGAGSCALDDAADDIA